MSDTAGVVDLEGSDGVRASVAGDGVAVVELCRPPNNFFDLAMIRRIADVYEQLAAEGGARAIVLCAQGKHFCAGADFSGRSSAGGGPKELYGEAIRLFEANLPVVAAVQGAAIGGGLGLACSADFRVAGPNARFSANFAQLGFHHGFALSATLPAIVGQQHALDLLYTGRRIKADEAVAMGLCDELVDNDNDNDDDNDDDVRAKARELAAQIARSAPLAVRSIRRTMRARLLDDVRRAVEREATEQVQLQTTADWAEGVRASMERRTPIFRGQ
jgi:2-(1,2-epoxy-1,2-dihydrophenyl)acetyl-CoA isomerase